MWIPSVSNYSGHNTKICIGPPTTKFQQNYSKWLNYTVRSACMINRRLERREQKKEDKIDRKEGIVFQQGRISII